MKSLKRIMPLLLILALCVFFVGCAQTQGTTDKPDQTQPQQPSKPDETKAPAEPADVSCWVNIGLHVDFYNQMAELWNEKNPDRPINMICELYGWEDASNKLLIAIQSGVGLPEIADLNLQIAHSFLKGAEEDIPFVPLNDIVEKYKDKLVLSRFEKFSKFGKYYSIDFHVGAMLTYYNTEIMEKAGVDYNSIVTWDDFIAAGRVVKEKVGVPMVGIETSDQRPFWPMIISQGSDYFDAQGNVTIDSQINIDTLQFLYDLIYVEGIGAGTPGGNTNNETCWAWINNGNVASMVMPSWYMSRFLAYMPDLEGKIAIRPMPIFKEGDHVSAAIGGTETAVLKDSANAAIAKDFLEFAKLSDEGVLKIWEMLQFDPVRKDAWDWPELNKPMPYFNNESPFAVMSKHKDDMPSPYLNEYSTSSQNYVKSAIFNAIGEGRSMTPAEALKQAADELRAEIALDK
jgi:arabinosaccharide transport system substrate-binding protein